MNVSALFIRRPIATMLLAIAVLLGGVLGYSFLPVSALPQVDFPTIQVTTQLPGANPDTMAELVTAPLERQLGQIPALQTMTSSSAFGLSSVTLQFGLDRDIDGAAQDVQAAINAAASTLPHNLPYPPVYSKVNPADAAVIELALTSKTLSIRALSDLADTLVGQRLSELSGVGHVGILGGLKPAVRVQADLQRLAAYGIGMEDLRNAISNANTNGAKGSLDGAAHAYAIGANDQLESADAYKSVVITYRNNAPVLMSDVADVVDGLENSHVAGWYQGKPAVIIDVQRQPGANVVSTVARIKAELKTLQASLPAGANMTVVSDRTGTIKASIADVQFTLVLSVVLVTLVVLLFLRSLRATIIAGVALPLSLIATFGGMYFMGFSLDNLSLMALTIGTGFVVDDAIVMIENIVRHLELGERPFEAALNGAREIGFTVISLTVSLIAVFIPLLFMTGIVGRMFREFALVLTLAVVASALVSLTLTPMMCGQLLRHRRVDLSRPPGFLARLGEGLSARYRASLVWVLRHQALMLLVTVGTLVATVALYITIPKGFLPPQDTGLISAVTDADPSVSFAEMSKLQEQAAARFRADPAVEGVTSVVGVGTVNATPNSGKLSIVLKPRDSGRAGVKAVIRRLQASVADLPSLSVTFQSVQDIQITAQSSRAPYQYTLNGTSRAEVSDWSNKLVTALQKSPVLRDVASEAQDGGLQLYVNIDRKLAGRLGISVQTVQDTLYDAFGQRQVSTIYGQANQYRVILEAQPRYLANSDSLKTLYVSSSSSAQVPLSTFTTLTHDTAPLTVDHTEQFPAVTISFDLANGASLGEAVQAIAKASTAIGLPREITGTFSGDAAEFSNSLANEPYLILAAAITIYIVLGVLYESAIQPITILSTLPSAGVGALLALMLFRMDLSLIALIGIVLLMGIVKKNAIMIIDFALDAERDGMTPHEAIVQASVLRFRPIMMTTLAALFGALPLAFATGTGSELRNPLGISIVGGLMLSQLITLYTTPVIYVAMESLRARVFGRVAAADPAAALPEEFEHRRAAE